MARVATGALKGLGGTGAAAGGLIAVGIAAAAAAVVGVSAEMRKNAVGMDQWKKESTGAIDWVVKKYGDLKQAASNWWDNTAVGGFMQERKEQKQQAEVDAAKEAVNEAIRPPNSPATPSKPNSKPPKLQAKPPKSPSSTPVYCKKLKTRKNALKKKNKKHKTCAIFGRLETQKPLRTEKPVRRRNAKRAPSSRPKRSPKIKAWARRSNSACKKYKSWPKARPMNAAAAQLAGFKGGGEVDANAQRQLDQAIKGFAQAGGSVEQLVAGLDGGAMGDPDKIVNALENLESVLPKDFAKQFIDAIKLARQRGRDKEHTMEALQLQPQTDIASDRPPA